MAAIEFTWDSRDLSVFRGKAITRALTRAMRLAGNQASKVLKEGTIAHVLDKKNLGRTTIEEDQKLNKPTRGAELHMLAWELFIRGQPVPVSAFPYLDTRRTSRRGVAVRFGTVGTERLAHAFVATMDSGHVGVFRRDPVKRMRADPRRAAINELFSYRLPKDLGGEVMTSLADPTYRKLKAHFEKGLDRELAKLKRKGNA